MTRGFVCYDARCPMCARFARRLGGFVRRRGFRLVPLQRSWVQRRLDADPKPVLDEIQLLLEDGRRLGGVDALLYLGRRVWWAWPVAVVLGLPGLRGLTRRAYAWVARHRMGISQFCGLDACRRTV